MPGSSREEKQHNYISKVTEFAAKLRLTPGQVCQIEVAHDDWCGLHEGGLCNCDPEIRLNTEARA